MEMERIMVNYIVHELCSYLAIKDIINLRRVSKFFNGKISKTHTYLLIESCRNASSETDLDKKIESRYDKVTEKLTLKDIGVILGVVLISPLVLTGIVFAAPWSFPCIYKRIKEFKNKCNLYSQYKKDNKKILEIYHNSLTDAKYFNITKYIIETFPNLIDMIKCRDLKTCIVYNNTLAFELLSSVFYKNKPEIPFNIIKIVLNFDNVHIWKLIEKYDPLYQQYASLFMQQEQNRKKYFMPKMLDHVIKQGYNFDYESIFTNSCSLGSLDMIKYLVENQLVDPTTKNNKGLEYAIKNKHIKCINYLTEI